MRNLPPDYLERLQASLSAGTRTAEQKTLEDSDEHGLHRLGALRHAGADPRASASTRSTSSSSRTSSSWTANPKFGFSLFGVSYMRLYGLMNHRTGPMKGPLSRRPRRISRRRCGRSPRRTASSPKRSGASGTWKVPRTITLRARSCDLLAAQFLRNIPEYANQKYDDGSTLAEQYEVRRAYFLKWFDERAKRGQFVEAASPSYQGDSIDALFNLRDFAEDAVLRKKADMYLDLAYAVHRRRNAAHDSRRPEEPRESRSRIRRRHERPRLRSALQRARTHLRRRWAMARCHEQLLSAAGRS